MHAVHKRRDHDGGDTENFPALCDENEAAAVFGWTDKQLDEISCEVEELDVINDLYEVTGISMDDVSGEEIPCKKAPIGFTYAGMRLLVLRDERGGIAGINERQMEPIMDELKNGQYSYHPAGAGDFLAACGPLGGLYTVLSFPLFSIIDKIQTIEPDAGRM